MSPELRRYNPGFPRRTGTSLLSDIPLHDATIHTGNATVAASIIAGGGSMSSTLGVNATNVDVWGSEREVTESEWIVRWIGAVVCMVLITMTLTGNVLVIVVVSRYRWLRSITNLLLASLATADITVAVFVMPYVVVYDLERRWRFGPIACHLWISCDVMCCTASILHLCVIALDRFWAITKPLRYRSCISKRRVGVIIVGIWVCSAAISFIPIFMGWYSDGPVSLFHDTPDCALKVNGIYAVVSSMTSFYLPLPVMFYVYFRILIIAERQSRQIKKLERSLHSTDQKVHRSIRRRSRQLITDTKAIRTLGIIMGVFCLCWLPFFLMYVILAYCVDCYVSYEVKTAITWLGYCNSSFNPCIYVFLNRDFKTAFKQALCCRRDRRRDSPALDEISSTASRSLQRMDRLRVDAFTPDIRTPSITPEVTAWPSNNLASSPLRPPTLCADGVKFGV